MTSLTQSTSPLEKLECVKFVNFSEDLLLERIEPGLTCRQPCGPSPRAVDHHVSRVETAAWEQGSQRQRDEAWWCCVPQHDRHKLSPHSTFMKLFPCLTSCIATGYYSWSHGELTLHLRYVCPPLSLTFFYKQFSNLTFSLLRCLICDLTPPPIPGTGKVHK